MNGVERAAHYVDDVLSGRLIAPKTIIQACERFARDLDRDDIYLDSSAANDAVRMIELLPHTKGKWQGKNIILENWQCFVVVNIFGFKWTKTGKRRFRYVYKQVPRKNGKSLLAICIGLLMFAADGEKGAEVYLGATSQDQAKKLLFLPAKYIAQKCLAFTDAYGIEVNASSLVKPEDFSRLEYVIKKPDDGTSPHCAIVDEYHLHDTPEQYDVFDTGMGSRDQPLLMVTTTAGSNLGGACKEKHKECKKILAGELKGETEFILIFEPDEDDEWDSIETLEKVNPNIGISVSRDYLLDQLEQAKRSSSKQTSFKTKHLNMWVGARNQWMNMHNWELAGRDISIEDYKHLPCEIALDLASKKDIAHATILFYDEKKDEYYTFQRSWCPESQLEENDSYRAFQTDGWLVATPGNMIDYEYIKEEIVSLHKELNVKSLAFDPYQATYLITELQKERINCIEFQHQVKTMSEPMKTVEALIADGKLFHDKNNCMTWMMGNCVARLDAKENIYPRKENESDPRCKIDGAVALIMAMGRWLVPDLEASPYESRGLRTL